MTSTRRQLFSAPPPDYAVPTGETLRLRLEELNMSQADLARRTSLTTKHVNQLIKGSVSLSPDVAQRLAYATGVPLHWWLRLEADYQAAKIRLTATAAPDADLDWVSAMPVAALIRAGALPAAPRDKPSRVQQLLAFFGVANVDAYHAVWGRSAVAFRQSHAFGIHDGAVTSWLRLGELAAQTLELPAYNASQLRHSLTKVPALTRRPIFEAVQSVLRVLHEAGVGAVFVPEITGARVYGAARWTATGKNPLIQLSMRGRTNDKMWLSLIHETGHLLLHDRKVVFLEDDTMDSDRVTAGEHDTAEREAEDFAWSILMPGLGRDDLTNVSTVADVHDVADTVGVDAAIVVLRLQSFGLWRFDQGNDLKQKVPAAAVGWRPPTVATADPSARAVRRADRRLPGEPR